MSDEPRERVTRADYQREPYVRATLPDGSIVDGKATAWTDTTVLVKWYDLGKPSDVVAGIPVHMHTAWVPAEQVARIKRSESTWIDVYDDYQHYEQLGEL